MEVWLSIMISTLTIYTLIGALEGLWIIYCKNFHPSPARPGPNLAEGIEHLNLSSFEILLVATLLWPLLLIATMYLPDPPDPDDKEPIREENVIHVDFTKKSQDENRRFKKAA